MKKQSEVKVGDGNRVKKYQIEAIRAKREYMGQSIENNDITKELDGEECLESPVRFKHKRDKALEKTAVAKKMTEEIIGKATKPDTISKHTKRKERLETNLDEIEKSN